MSKSSTSGAIPKFAVSAKSSQALHTQIYHRIRQAVLTGTLAPGSRLPATRLLAEELDVSRTTVLAAYGQLLSEGYVEGRVGSGTRIARHLPDDLLQTPTRTPEKRPRTGKRALLVPPEAQTAPDRHLNPFGPEFRLPTKDWKTCFRLAVPALDLVPFNIWARLVGKHVRRAARETIDYNDALGLPRLRKAIAAHILLSRGISCVPGQILICAGAQSGIDLVARTLLAPGDHVLVEDPCHLGFVGALGAAKARMTPMPIDDSGMALPVGRRAGARMAFVTPSNQFPLAVTMSLARRLALLDWAHRTGAWIIEDDYDSEFRYDSRPVPALLSLDQQERVLYVGSFSKSLYPGLRLGFLVLPGNLVDLFAARRRFIDFHPPMLPQAALADFIADGHFNRHIRRMRKTYSERAEALKHHVDRTAKGLAELSKPQSGLHSVLWLPSALDDQVISRKAAERGIEARALSLYGEARQRPGLVLGFGTVTPEEIAKGVTLLAKVVAAASGRR